MNKYINSKNNKNYSGYNKNKYKKIKIKISFFPYFQQNNNKISFLNFLNGVIAFKKSNEIEFISIKETFSFSSNLSGN